MSKATERVEVCTCENCGNEAEMVVTCELVPVTEREREAGVAKKEKKTFTCVHCGNEADMIVEL